MKWSAKKFKAILSFLSLSCLLAAAPLQAQTAEEKGFKIMEKMDRLPVHEKVLSDMVMNIYDSQGKKLFSKKSRMASYQSDYKDPAKRLSRTIAYFYSPADDKGNGSLITEQDGDKDDDQWLYLKGLRKPKRIVGSDKSSSFMGSDFSNGDISPRDLEDFNFTWLATEKVAFKKKKLTVQKIQAVFKEEQKKKDYGYSKTNLWVHPKTGLVFKMEMYNLNDQLMKRARLLSFKVLKNRDNKKIFISTSLEMKNIIKGTKTIMKTKNLRVEKKAKSVKSGMFKVAYLTRRWW